MPVLARIVVIRRSGSDGSQFPITGDTCVFGRDTNCDIRIQLPFVSNVQCRLELGESGYSLCNMSETNITNVNNKAVPEKLVLKDKDVITIVDRSFRFEYPDGSPYLKINETPETGKRTPLGTPLFAGQRKENDKQDSPFGMLVRDMKSIIKRTPRKEKSSKDNKDENKRETPKAQYTSNSTAPRAQRNSTPKSTTKGKDKRKSVTSTNAVGSENIQPETPVTSISSVADSKTCCADADEKSSNSADTVFPDNKENSALKQRSARRRSRNNTSQHLAHSSPSLKARSDSSDDKTKSSSYKAKDVERIATGKLVQNQLSISAEVTPKKVEHTLSKCVDLADNATPVSVEGCTAHPLIETQKRDTETAKSKRSSRRRSSLAKSIANLEASDTANFSLPDSSIDKNKNTSFLNESKQSAADSIQSPASDSLNSSQSLDVMDVGMMITEISTDDSMETVNGEPMIKRRSPRLSSSQKITSNFSESVEVEKESVPSPRRDLLEKGCNETSLTEVPNISLTPSKENEKPSVNAAEDPYCFPESGDSSIVKEKKIRRKSLGSSGMSRKQTLLLFGSPRVQKVTPLRSSLGRLRRKSEPLPEDDESAASPMELKKWTPLPHVEEVENNSSPIKKSRKSAYLVQTSSHFYKNNTPPVAKISRRVSFGPDLSPEQFLKTLPPNTPIKKGAAPCVTTRSRSLAASGNANLPTLEENEPQAMEARGDTPTNVSYQKVTRTPTPLKPDLSRAKPKSLLHQVLNTTMLNKRQSSLSSSPTLPVKENISKKVAAGLGKEQESFVDVTRKGRPPINNKTSAKKRRSSLNTQIVNVHKTATNLYRRRSSRSLSKPLWSDIVKKPATATSKPLKKAPNNNAQPKKSAKHAELAAEDSNRHIDSPDTIYIGRTRSRIQPTRTPKPPKSSVPVKLDLPLNESYTGLSELFSTPEQSATAYDEDVYDDLKTPKSVGEMLISPLSATDISMSHSDDLETTPVKNIDFSDEAMEEDVSLIEEASVNRISSPAASKEIIPNRRSSPRLTLNVQHDAAADQSDVVVDTFVSKKPSNRKKNDPVEEHFGMKRLLKTPKDSKSKPVSEHFGVKRLVKTPRSLKKSKPVTEHLGTKRLLKSPRDRKKPTPVTEHFGTKRLLKTPRYTQKSTPVQKHFGTKRLLKTPKEKNLSEPVTEHFGTKRLLQTPRDSEKSTAVEEHLNLKRVLRTPRESKTKAVTEHFGTKRLMQSPKDKAKSKPVESKFGLARLFYIPKEKAETAKIYDGDLFLDSLMASPEALPDKHAQSPLQPAIADMPVEPVAAISEKNITSKRSEQEVLQKPLFTSATDNASVIVHEKESTRHSRQNDIAATTKQCEEAIISSKNTPSNTASVTLLETGNEANVLTPRSGRRKKKTDPMELSIVVNTDQTISSVEEKHSEEHVTKTERAKRNVTFHPSVKITDGQLSSSSESKQTSRKGRQKKDSSPQIEETVKPVPKKPKTVARKGRPKKAQLKEGNTNTDAEKEEVVSDEKIKATHPTKEESDPVKQPIRRGRLKNVHHEEEKVDVENKEKSISTEKIEDTLPIKVVAKRGRSKKVEIIDVSKASKAVSNRKRRWKSEAADKPGTIEGETCPPPPKRSGRSTQKTSVGEQLIEKMEAVTDSPAKVTPAKTMGRRGRSNKNVESKEQLEKKMETVIESDTKVTPVKTVTRKGRSNKNVTSEEKTADMIVNTEAQAENIIPRKVTARRGGAKKKAETSAVKEQETITALKTSIKVRSKKAIADNTNEVKEDETKKSTESKATVSTRKRRGAPPSGSEQSTDNNSPPPAKRSGRATAQKTSAAVPTITDTKDVAAPVEKRTRKGRPKKVEAASADTTETAAQEKVVAPAKDDAAPTEKKTRKGRAKKVEDASTNSLEKPRKLVEKATKSAEKVEEIVPRRAGRSKKATTDQEKVAPAAVAPVQIRRSSRRK